MSKPTPRRPFPRGALIGAGVLIAFTIASAATARLAKTGGSGMPDGAPLESRVVRFEDRNDGAIAVFDGSRVVEVLAPGTNGFARGALRGLARERKQRGLGAELPFRVSRWPDGQLMLEDLATQRRVALDAFGPTNAEVFARLLHARGDAR